MLGYFTCDAIGSQTGGGIVTKNELDALTTLGEVKVFNPNPTASPFEAENQIINEDFSNIKLAYFYSGTFSKTIRKLKKQGSKIIYTAAAHDVDLSKKEFESLGLNFNAPHLTDASLFKEYVDGYLLADLVICPSQHSKKIMEKFGCKNVVVVPHGTHIMKAKAKPSRFTVGYLGQIGPDKGLIYLLKAWANLNYKDAVLTLAGSQTTSLIHIIRQLGKGNFNILGFVKNIEDFYNQINIYVQPSVTEGFGIEVLESLACGRPVIVSDGAGAADCVGDCGFVVEKKSIKKLMEVIDYNKNNNFTTIEECQKQAEKYTWDKIKESYRKEISLILNS